MVWLNVGQMLGVNAKKFPKKMAVKDAKRSLTYPQLHERTNRLANALHGLGLKKGDRVAMLFNNCVEFAECYLAAAKAGIVVVPVNFRQVGKEIEYVVNNSESKAFIVAGEYLQKVEEIKHNLSHVGKNMYIFVGEDIPNGYHDYEKLIAQAPADEIKVALDDHDPWIILYTSGTTGVPKGVIRSHESYCAFYLINAVDFGFSEKDVGLIVMPMFHVNSTFYGFVFNYIGASWYIHRATDFDATELLGLIAREKATFTSLIPTHYNLILAVPEETRNRLDLSSMKKLLCSSAPARSEMKKGIMKVFPNAELFEAYGSTEAGMVTLLKPEDQYRKLASIGPECLGTDTLRLLGEDGREVPVGEVGELYSRGPMMFTEYYKLPEKTKKSFRDGFFTAGDMAKKDDEGYYYIVDRKDNMIITGGEHAYPTEIEGILCQNPKVFDCAIIGVPDAKWGEAVKAIVILKDGQTATEDEILEFCRGRMAAYKRPKSVEFIKRDEMPRTANGKTLHRVLREKHAKK